MSYFISILEKLDVIRLWDFQSHSAGGSAVITNPGMSLCAVLSGPMSRLIFLFPQNGLMPDSGGLSWSHRFLIAVHVTSLGTSIRFDHPLGDRAGFLALPDEFRTCLSSFSCACFI